MRRLWPAVLALVAMCLLTGPTAPTASAAPADPPRSGAGSGAIVVVGVPDLRWQDVTAATTPTLWRLAGRSSVATMTDRSGEPLTRRAVGWVSLNSGTRARADVEPTVVPDPADPTQLRALRAANAAAAYRAQVGALGDALRRAGVAAATVGGPGAVLGAMAGDGTAGARAPSVAAALADADVVVVELPQLYGLDRRDAGGVGKALTEIDAAVGTILDQLPRDASLLLAGVSEASAGPAHLHVAMATGPSFAPGSLTSPSTGRDGVVQLIDLAPTVLSLVGAPVPGRMAGAPWRATPSTGAPLSSRVAAFVELDERSVIGRASLHWYYPAVAGTALLYVVITLIGWSRRRGRLLRPLGAVVAAVPLAGYLMQLVPWWRAGSWPQLPLTAAIATALGLAASSTPWARHNRWGAAAVLGATTMAVLAGDAATGSPLSLDAPFADNPLIAGRFHGLGNVAFALLGAATLILSGALAAGRAPRRAASVVCGLGAVAVAVDGLPSLGDDFGGVLALLPAVAVLAIVVARVRVSAWHVVAVVGTTVLTTAAFALYDFSRPAAQRTHVGRFIAAVDSGAAGTVVNRKLDTSLGTFSAGWPRWIVLGWVVLALAAWLAHRQGRLRVPPGVDARTAGGLLAALVTLAVLGAAVNDSGLEITAFTFYLAAPLLAPLLEPGGASSRQSAPEPRAAGRVGAAGS